MKKFLIVLTILLSGCSTVDKVKQMWPRAHDSALVSGYVNLETSLEVADCKVKDNFDTILKHADWLNRYAEFRNDPQKISTKAILDNIHKAKDGNVAVCERWISLSKTRMKIIKESWSGR